MHHDNSRKHSKSTKDAIIIHKCDSFIQIDSDFQCNMNYLYAHGNAIGEKFYNFGDSEYFFTDNSEYTNAIKFCPFCGIQLSELLIAESKPLDLNILQANSLKELNKPTQADEKNS